MVTKSALMSAYWCAKNFHCDRSPIVFVNDEDCAVVGANCRKARKNLYRNIDAAYTLYAFDDDGAHRLANRAARH